MDDKKLPSLLRLTSTEYQKEVESNLNICFDSLYDIVDSVRENVEQLEGLIDRICFAVSPTPIDAKAMRGRLIL